MTVTDFGEVGRSTNIIGWFCTRKSQNNIIFWVHIVPIDLPRGFLFFDSVGIKTVGIKAATENVRTLTSK